MDRIKISTRIVAALLGICLPATSATVSAQDRAKFSAVYQVQRGTRLGRIVLTAQMRPADHIYALTQKGTPPPSKITVGKSEQFAVTGAFEPDIRPIVIERDPLFENRIEKHTQTVVFTAPIQLTERANATQLNVQLKFDGQVCSRGGSCFPLFGKKVAVKFGGYYKSKPEPGNLK